jgi:dipeptidyl aminopeptidase/acylaminoacyl peptidase
MRLFSFPLCVIALLPSSAPATQAPAQKAPAAAGYRLPPPAVRDVLDAAPTPDASLSPDARWMLLVENPAMPSIEEVTRPWTGLAGIRVDTALRAPHTTSSISAITLRDLEGTLTQKVPLPAGGRVLSVSWAPTSDRIALTLATEKGIDLYVAPVPGGVPVKVGLPGPLAAVLGRSFTWLPDRAGLLVKTVPTARATESATKPAETRPAAPTGPNVQETSGKSSPLRTYQDLLRSPADEALFEQYAESQICEVSLVDGAVRNVGSPGLIAGMDISPDGKHILVTRLKRPFSYVLSWSSFPMTIEVWSISGALETTVADVKMGDDIPMEGVRTTPRDVHWQPTAPATLWWVQALDGGDPKRKAEKRDRWSRLEAPFQGEPKTAFEMTWRARGLDWLTAPAYVIAAEYDRDKKWTRTHLHDLTKPGEKPRLVDDRSVNDRYGDAGAFVTTLLPTGDRVLRQDGTFLYRSGSGATEEGDQPFLDRYDFSTGRTERMWRSTNTSYERAVAIVSSSITTKPAIVTSYESPTEPPNYRLRDLESGKITALTNFPDPQPAMRGIEQKLVKYARKDGVRLSATLYLPKDRPAGVRLPLFVWAYPNEFTDASTAGQVSGSPNRFVRVRGPSQILFALHGWAVMDNASMPVIGTPELVNDTFIEQIVMNAQAAIDEADRLGVADPNRVAVGGHSYGAFMTANLLAHCDLFKAGVCRSGAYNRTLTPFGFQSERRTIWEAPKAYLELSPFLSAHKINEPVLFIHGEKDDNMGTFPIQSERMYQAVKGNGGTARLVMLPGEAHGYRARESVMQTVAETFDWLDKHVRDIKTDLGEKTMEAGSPR